MAVDSLQSNKILYLDLTHKLNDYNEIYNLNTYLDGANSTELERLSYTNETLKTRLLKLKQEYLLEDRGVKAYTFRSNILYFTTIITSIVLCLAAVYVEGGAGGLSAQMAVMISIGIIVVYFIILLFIVRANIERRYYAYDQYYWDQMKKKT